MIIQGPFLNASYFSMAQQLDLPLTQVVLVSGYNLLAAGCIGPFVAAFSRKYGKRPVFLVSALFDIVGTAVGQAKIDYNYLLAARIIQGLSTSAFESIIVATVGDIYFVHQRGLRVSFINFVLNSASSLASIICGLVFANLGWLWLFHLYQIFLVIQFVAMFLFCPETTYIRDHIYDTDETGEATGKELAKSEHREVAATRDVPPKKTFVQSLAVWTGVYSHDSFFKFLVGPFLTLLNPAACYAVISECISRRLQSITATKPLLTFDPSFRSVERLVCRLGHHPGGHLLRSAVDVRSFTDRLPWSGTVRRWYDRQYSRRLAERSCHQVGCEEKWRHLVRIGSSIGQVQDD